ncbi:MAG: hypothetical protein C0403_04830 [Desulfobacterium sp.]|nr:hypothetical protein [Desulfobacterium sp.]
MQHYSEYHKLLATQAHIWFCHPSEFDNSSELDLAKNWLSKEELKKYQKIYFNLHFALRPEPPQDVNFYGGAGVAVTF